MKRLFLAVTACSLVLTALALSGGRNAVGPFQATVEERNPWTHLNLNDAPENFHFTIVSDRTGGHRARIFSMAVDQINLLQPAFVLSVGDLIEGYTKDRKILEQEWKEFQGYVGKLQMPFFYVPGNHDITNEVMIKEWNGRFGRPYYHFRYRDVLFLCLHSSDPSEAVSKAQLSKEQLAYMEKALQDNKDVRWTIVAVHKPMWVMDNLSKSGWLDLEKLLADRPYTVFAGHVHRYQKFVRQGRHYYMLATTGGGSRLRGASYGEFDHLTWVTMKKDGPTVANILLDGILPEDLERVSTMEKGVVRRNLKPVHPSRGRLFLDGVALPEAAVVLWLPDKEGKKYTRTADALSEADGSFALTTYDREDGAPVGEYVVTVQSRTSWPSGRTAKNTLPAQYADPKTTPLRFRVESGANEAEFHLLSKGK